MALTVSPAGSTSTMRTVLIALAAPPELVITKVNVNASPTLRACGLGCDLVMRTCGATCTVSKSMAQPAGTALPVQACV